MNSALHIVPQWPKELDINRRELILGKMIKCVPTSPAALAAGDSCRECVFAETESCAAPGNLICTPGMGRSDKKFIVFIELNESVTNEAIL